jgi:hypothetical protein
MNSYKKIVLEAYFGESDSGRFTSQDVCDNLRDPVTLTPDEVTEYMVANGYGLQREDDRLVWVIK